MNDKLLKAFVELVEASFERDFPRRERRQVQARGARVRRGRGRTRRDPRRPGARVAAQLGALAVGEAGGFGTGRAGSEPGCTGFGRTVIANRAGANAGAFSSPFRPAATPPRQHDRT